MTALIILSSIAAVLIYVFTVKISFCVEAGNVLTYKNYGVFIKIGFLKFNIYPAKQKKEKKRKKKGEEKKDKVKPAKKAKPKEEKKSKIAVKDKSVKEIIDFSLLLFKSIIGKFRKHLKFDFGYLYISAASEDAYKTALLYGAVSQSAFYLKELFENNLNAKFRRITVVSDFTKEKTEFYVNLRISMRVHRILNVGLGAGWKFIKEFVLKNAKKADNIEVK